jgi:hypothetical protein
MTTLEKLTYAKPLAEGLSNPRIVCAAILRIKDGKMLLGARHYDSHMRQHLVRDWLSVEVEQGFVDQHGRFLTREEAWEIAEKEGQIRVILPCQDNYETKLLYSENLY